MAELALNIKKLEYRKCRVCHETKKISLYHVDNGRKDGISSLCKVCALARKEERAKYFRSIISITSGTLICNKCNEEKDVSKFPKCRANKNGYAGCCRKCNHERNKRNPTYQINKNESARRNQYKITKQEYVALLEKYSVCAICGTNSGKRGLCIDHDHKTNKVRGMLCDRCNMALGFLNDDIGLLYKSIEYLNKHK